MTQLKSNFPFFNIFNVGAALGGPAANQVWGKVGFSTYRRHELLGYVDCSAGDDPSRTNFASGPITISDLDGDGVEELVFVGRTFKFCGGGAERTTHNGLYIMNKDRTRWAKGIYNWTVVPDKMVSRKFSFLVMMANFMCSGLVCASEPVVVDFDNDGKAEIVVSVWAAKGTKDWGSLVIPR